MTFLEFAKLYNEETTTGDVASVDSKLMKKPKKKCKKTLEKSNKVDEKALAAPTDILRDNNIKVKSSDMDDKSYIVILFKKDDVKTAEDVLEKEGYTINTVGKLLYISYFI